VARRRITGAVWRARLDALKVEEDQADAAVPVAVHAQ
jgi:hypothetical protein